MIFFLQKKVLLYNVYTMNTFIFGYDHFKNISTELSWLDGVPLKHSLCDSLTIDVYTLTLHYIHSIAI